MANRPLFRVHMSALAPAVLAASEAVDHGSKIPILETIRIAPEGERLILTATDLTIEVRASCEAMEVSDAMPFTVSGSALRDIARTLPESAELAFTYDDTRRQVLITYGRHARFTLLTLEADAFPSIGSLRAQPFEVDMPQLLAAMGRVQYAVKPDETRVYLSGTYLHAEGQRLVVVGCDGHNLAINSLEVPSEPQMPGIIIPIATAKAMMKLFSQAKTATIRGSDMMFEVSTPEVSMMSKLVDGIYPDYGRVVPNGCGLVARVPVDALKKALARVSLVIKDGAVDTLRLHLEDDACRLEIRARDGEEAREEVTATYSAEPVTIGFHGRYLQKLLDSIKTSDVEIRLCDAATAGIFRPSIETTETYVLMPRRL